MFKFGATYIAFVDDLFLISVVIEHSFCLVRDTVAEFGSLSGLKPNLHKSSVYVAGESDEVGQQLCNILEMPKGELVVKYLGLPLISTKLSYKDYQPVSMKMQQRVQSWAAKSLPMEVGCSFSYLSLVVSTSVGLVFLH